MARSLIIDCDPGVDDAIAILLTLAVPDRLNLLGITTVAGNVPLDLTQSNARKICELAGRTEVKVYAGCPRPLLRSLHTAADVHGATGLQGAALPEPTMPLQPQHGVDFLVEQLMQAEQPITLAVLGPMTNIAIALIKHPEIIQNIAEIVIMGGAVTQGNVTSSAEFNLYVDPHAAQVVFDAGAPITLIPLDTTHQLLTTPARLETIRQIGTPVAQAAAGMLAFYGMPDSQRYGLPGAPLHDPCVIVYLLEPNLFTTQAVHVAVETQGTHTLGRTVVDLWNVSGQSPNLQITRSLDAESVYALIIDGLAKL
ncbi:nucleoside hydrolase [Romeria aff. gracilis LEGE 07310]|uniref:Nucleoside hydrolase n=1 Tax=Vasconcelosia minhoensis LEGE 07310 TaxID=915328 RepID=A0A8J7DEC2_9CYAN|nr:nucleoside hydrolase [Romeria gracilis]MBE9079688.1 nucleoside hydrolase [Romeria aff. gracilis LEGE 07310]